MTTIPNLSEMRVLVVTRNDTAHVIGGDHVAFQKIAQYIKPLGVHMEIVSVDDLPRKSGTDIVHLTQIYQLEDAFFVQQWAQKQQAPLFISCFYEEKLHMWFDRAMRKRGKWRWLAQIFGRNLTHYLHYRWHMTNRKRSKVWRRQRILLQNSCVVPNSQYEKNHLSQWFDLKHLNANIVPLGIDPDVFDRIDSSLELPELDGLENFVLTVGRIEERKNHLGLLEALREASYPVLFVGKPYQYEPEYVAACKQVAQSRGNVHFIDHIPHHVLPQIYARAAVHVLPSWSERPGLVSLEAAACGCKVVGSITSSIGDYLGNLAWYCRPDNLDDIRSTVERARAAPIPQELSKTVRNSFTWEKTARKMKRVYERALVS